MLRELLAGLNWIECHWEMALFHPQHMPINYLHLQSQEAPLERSLLLKMFLIMVRWVHQPLCCFQSLLCDHWRGCSLDFYSWRGRMKLSEESSGVYNHSGGTGICAQAGWLLQPLFFWTPCSLFWFLFPCLLSDSSHLCSQTLLYWFHRPRWCIHTWYRHASQPKEPSDSEIRESTLLQR